MQLVSHVQTSYNRLLFTSYYAFSCQHPVPINNTGPLNFTCANVLNTNVLRHLCLIITLGHRKPLLCHLVHHKSLLNYSEYVTGFVKRGLVHASDFANLMSHNFVCD